MVWSVVCNPIYFTPVCTEDEYTLKSESGNHPLSLSFGGNQQAAVGSYKHNSTHGALYNIGVGKVFFWQRVIERYIF